MTEQRLRQELLTVSRRLEELGLNRGTSGNASIRCDDYFLLTPSAVAVADMTPEHMVAMDFNGRPHRPADRPSSEWCIHRDILAARPEAAAVVHAHPPFATGLACLRRDIPAFHYMIAVAGGDSIRCAPYALFGSQALSEYVLTALKDRTACLMANHGIITLGGDPHQALALAVEVETLCEQYWRASSIGEPALLSDEQMDEVIKRFRSYR